MNTHRDPWSIATPTGNREDIFERGTVTRAQLFPEDTTPED